jgi:hypothetical protein
MKSVPTAFQPLHRLPPHRGRAGGRAALRPSWSSFSRFGYERHTHFHAFDVMLHGRADSVLGAVQDAEDTGDNVMLDQADLHVPPATFTKCTIRARPLLGRSPNWQGQRPTCHPPRQARPSRQSRTQWPRLPRPSAAWLAHRGPRRARRRQAAPGHHSLRRTHRACVARHSWRSRVLCRRAAFCCSLVTGPLIAWLLHRGLLPLRQLAALASQVSVDAWQFSPARQRAHHSRAGPAHPRYRERPAAPGARFVQQRTFVSDAAHELKTAVAVVKSSLQLLGMKRRTAAEYQAGLERCLADSARLEEIGGQDAHPGPRGKRRNHRHYRPGLQPICLPEQYRRSTGDLCCPARRQGDRRGTAC